MNEIIAYIIVSIQFSSSLIHIFIIHNCFCFTAANQSKPTATHHHAPLRRMPSFAPPNSLPITNTSVHDWLQSNDAHLSQGSCRSQSVLSDHAPLSPQSSTASSGSGSDGHGEDPLHPTKNTFMDEGSGMRGKHRLN